MKTLVEILGRDADELRASFVGELRSRGWDRLLGKAGGGEQSLLDHTLAVFDVLCGCAPFFAEAASPALTGDEMAALLLAAVAHDAGKAASDFQAYLRAYLRGESSKFAEHVEPEAIRAIACAVAASANLVLSDRIEDVVSQAMLHDRRVRSTRGELIEWGREHASPRWRSLADYVNHADSLASATDLMAAEDFLRKLPQRRLVGDANVTSYRVRVRGVSTTLLHEAALATFEAAGWRPLVFFAEGTLFAGLDVAEPDRADVESRMHGLLTKLLDARADRLPELAVGSPLTTFLPHPEYVRRDNLELLWRVASRRAKRKTSLKPDEEAKFRTQWTKELPEGPAIEARDLEALRDIGPEACALKLAKNLFDHILDDSARARMKGVFDASFGPGSFNELMKQSTFMPVKDYLLCVRPWHELPSSNVEQPGVARVGDLEPTRRLDRLIERLVALTAEVLNDATVRLPNDDLIDDWSKRALDDLTLCDVLDRKVVEQELAGYSGLNADGRAKEKLFLQCDHCAGLIQPGEAVGTSDAAGDSSSFSNRAPAFASSANVRVCRACKFDLGLGQLLLGGKIETAIALVPRRALGPAAANALVSAVRGLRTVLDRELSAETMDPKRYIALTLPVQMLSVDLPLSECLVRDVSANTQKKRRKEWPEKVAAVLDERIGAAGLDDFNAEHATRYATLKELATAVIADEAPSSVRADADVIASLATVSRVRLDFASVTPNLIVVSIGSDLGSADDGDADRAFYGFGLATLFAVDLNMACFVGPLSELRTALSTRAGRAIYVPANGPARRVLGGDWLGFTHALRWLRAVRAAIALRQPLEARSVLEVLKYPSAGFAVRRVDQQAASPFWPKLWPHIEALKEVLG